MNLRKLIFTDAGDTSEGKQEQKQEPIKSFPTTQEPVKMVFPTQPVAAPATSFSFGAVNSDHLDKFIEMYQNGFEGLNQAGYDFFEFFQAIMSGNAMDNPSAYQMVMTMGKGMDKTITKEKLVSQADMYLTEINRVYASYVQSGQSKKEELVHQKQAENSTLNSELEILRQQLEGIKSQIQTKETQLALIDGKYNPQLTEVDEKLKANDTAKNRLVETITKVKTGIVNNVK